MKKPKKTKVEDVGEEIGLGEIMLLLVEEKTADEVLERTITKYGTSCHIPIPSKHEGKKAKVIIHPNDDVLSNPNSEKFNQSLRKMERKQLRRLKDS